MGDWRFIEGACRGSCRDRKWLLGTVYDRSRHSASVPEQLGTTLRRSYALGGEHLDEKTLRWACCCFVAVLGCTMSCPRETYSIPECPNVATGLPRDSGCVCP